MPISQEIKQSVYGGVNTQRVRFVDDYKIFYNGVCKCKIYKENAIAIYSFDIETFGYSVYDTYKPFCEALDVQVFPVPKEIFEDGLSGMETDTAGRFWVRMFSIIVDDIHNGVRMSFQSMELIFDRYFHLYKSISTRPPIEMDMVISHVNIDDMKAVYQAKRKNQHLAYIEDTLIKWRNSDTEINILKNKTGFEYIRYNKDTLMYETTLGLLINEHVFADAISKYNTGIKEFSFDATYLCLDKNNKDVFTGVNVPINVLENGDVVVNCVTIKKEEFLNAYNHD